MANDTYPTDPVSRVNYIRGLEMAKGDHMAFLLSQLEAKDSQLCAMREKVKGLPVQSYDLGLLHIHLEDWNELQLAILDTSSCEHEKKLEEVQASNERLLNLADTCTRDLHEAEEAKEQAEARATKAEQQLQQAQAEFVKRWRGC